MNKNCMVFVAVVVLCYFSAFSMNGFAALTAQLDRDRVTEGESIRLTIEAAGQISAMPDTDPLNKDFEVTGTMSGSRVNIVNGNMDSRTTWTISLVPRRSGTLTIPSLQLNGESTPESTVHVSDASANTAPDAKLPIFIETEVDQTDPYVQGMVRYTQRVFFAVNLAQGSLSEPEQENILVRKLGEDREYVTQRNGRSYNVIEREFVIFPQISGSLVIPASVLNAQILESTRRQDPFFDRFFSSTRPIRLRSDAITLNVRPRPDQSQSLYWLPAESVELHESWQPEDNAIDFGDPLTRHITIKARGVTGEQLPELKLTDPSGFKLYPDRPQSSTQNLQHTVQGEKILRFAYMPTQPGKHVLPELTLHWWNTETDSEQIATLSARTIDVLPASGSQQQSAAPFPDTVDSSDRSVPERNVQPGTGHQLPLSEGSEAQTWVAGHSAWFWVAIVFAVLWLITLGLFGVFWRKRHDPLKSTREEKERSKESENTRKARKNFLAACQNNDPQQARHHLLKWAATHWPESPPRGLEALASRLDDPAVYQALTDLDRLLYLDRNENWDGRELARLLSKLPQHDHDSGCNKSGSTLPKLYT